MASKKPAVYPLPPSAISFPLFLLPFLIPASTRADTDAEACSGYAQLFSRTEDAATRLKDCARTHSDRNERIACVGTVSPTFREAVYEIRCQDDCEDASEADRRACYIINANVFRGRLEGMGVSPSRIDRLRAEASEGNSSPQTEDQWRDYLETLATTLRTEEGLADLGGSGEHRVTPTAPAPRPSPIASGCAELREFTALTEQPGCRRPHRSVHLTFDDGPLQDRRTESGVVRTTSSVLDTLRSENIPATFFVLGELLDPAKPSNSPEELAGRFRLTRRMQAEGHLIASHSYSHETHTGLSPSEIAENVRKARSAGVGYEVDGRPVEPYLSGVYRLPYGDGATRSSVRPEISRIFEAQGFRRHLYWNVDTEDWRRANRDDPDRLLRGMMQQLCREGGGTILFHDIHASTARNLPRYIQALRCAGYPFGPLSDVLGGRVPALDSPTSGRSESVSTRTSPSSDRSATSTRPTSNPTSGQAGSAAK